MPSGHIELPWGYILYMQYTARKTFGSKKPTVNAEVVPQRSASSKNKSAQLRLNLHLAHNIGEVTISIYLSIIPNIPSRFHMLAVYIHVSNDATNSDYRRERGRGEEEGLGSMFYYCCPPGPYAALLASRITLRSL